MEIPFVNIHTHSCVDVMQTNTVTVCNIALNNEELTMKPPYSVGLHPWYGTKKDNERYFVALRQAVKHSDVLAVGECGLDKNAQMPMEEQLALFEAQVKLAKEVGKPLIIHCVRAFGEIIAVLNKLMFTEAVVFHGFRKNITLARQLTDHGFYLSIGPHCLNGSQDQLLKDIPLDHLVLETDMQFEIAIETLYHYVAGIRSISVVELKKIIYKNFRNIIKQ